MKAITQLQWICKNINDKWWYTWEMFLYILWSSWMNAVIHIWCWLKEKIARINLGFFVCLNQAPTDLYYDFKQFFFYIYINICLLFNNQYIFIINLITNINSCNFSIAQQFAIHVCFKSLVNLSIFKYFFF